MPRAKPEYITLKWLWIKVLFELEISYFEALVRPPYRDNFLVFSLLRKYPVFLGHNIRAFVRDQKKLQKMVSKLKLDEVKLKKLEVIECDIFDSNTLNLSHIDLVVSCLGFHRRNNKAMKIDHYSRFGFRGLYTYNVYV